MFNRSTISKIEYLKRIFSSQFVFFVIGLILLVAVGFPAVKNLTRQYKINLEIKELEKEIGEQESKKLELNKLIDYLDSNEFAEEQARLNLNFKKPGEQVVVIASEGITATSTGEPDPSKSIFRLTGAGKKVGEEETSNPQKWWQYFFASRPGRD